MINTNCAIDSEKEQIDHLPQHIDIDDEVRTVIKNHKSYFEKAEKSQAIYERIKKINDEIWRQLLSLANLRRSRFDQDKYE